MKKMIFAGITLLAAGCESVVEVDIPLEDPKIVVNSFFSPDSVFKVHISESRHILDNSELPVNNNASVEIYQGNSLVATLPAVGDGYYLGNVQPVAEGIYRVTVSTPGFESVSASNKVPGHIPITLGDTSRVDQQDGLQLRIAVTFNDPADEQNFYGLTATGNVLNFLWNPMTGELDTVSEIRPLYISSYDLPVNDVTASLSGLMFNDEVFDGKEVRFHVNISDYEAGQGTIQFYLHHLSREYYLYSLSLGSNLYNSGNPFAEPTQVFTNIENGFGIFAGYSTYNDSLIVQ